MLLAVGLGGARSLDAAEIAPARFQQGLNELAAASALHIGVAIKDLVAGDEFFVNADGVFPLASSIRIFLVEELYRQASAGKLAVDEVRLLPATASTGGSGVLRYMDRGTVSMSLRDYATLVVTVNDNSAANFLTDLLGMDNVNASLAAQGTPEIKFRRRAVSRREAPGAPENVGTARAMMRALDLLHRGQVVDRATSDAIIGVLALPEISYFRRELPYGVAFAGRSGSGPTNRSDAGIVLLPERPYALVVLVKGLRPRPPGQQDYSAADRVIGAVTRLAGEYFAPKSSLSVRRDGASKAAVK